MFFFSTLLLSLYPVMGELMMSTWPPDIAPDPTCLPYDGSKVPDCSDYLGSRGDPVFIEHSFNCSRFWVCEPTNSPCLEECPSCGEGCGALFFDGRVQHPYGPVCNWPDLIDCSHGCECGEEQVCVGGECQDITTAATTSTITTTKTTKTTTISTPRPTITTTKTTASTTPRPTITTTSSSKPSTTTDPPTQGTTTTDVPSTTHRGGQIPKPYVESYWESWDSWRDFPGDFAAFLEDVPVSSVGSCKGVNLVNIAFGDYSGGVAGHEATEEMIRKGIEAIHQKGGYAKIALGGAKYSMSFHVHSVEDATDFAKKMAEAANDLGLDGMDLDVEDSGADADVQIAVIKETRRLLGPNFHITYTISALTSQIEPWRSTIMATVSELDAVNVMGYDVYWEGWNIDQDVEQLVGLGVPLDKIVYGVMPGHHDAANEYTTVEDAVEAAKYVLEKGLGGVMTWDINRDCRGRMGNPSGEDNLFQTGQGDAVYLDAISSGLNRCSA